MSNRMTLDTLADDLAGELNQDLFASGSPPARLKRMIIRAGTWIWNLRDWSFRHTSTTLTTVASQAYVDLPADFRELDVHRLRDNDDLVTIHMTTDPARFQAEADCWTDNAPPVMGLISLQSDESWRLHLTPTPDAAYSLPIWYMLSDPWHAAVALADDASPVWPETFDLGWYWASVYMALRGYRADGAWAESKREFRDWLVQTVNEMDETVTTNPDRIADAYGDLSAMALPHPGIDSSSGLPRY